MAGLLRILPPVQLDMAVGKGEATGAAMIGRRNIHKRSRASLGNSCVAAGSGRADGPNIIIAIVDAVGVLIEEQEKRRRLGDAADFQPLGQVWIERVFHLVVVALIYR